LDNAQVIGVDEKSQRQALERTPLMLSMGFGYVVRVKLCQLACRLVPSFSADPER
jgi:hypothetical protein